MKTANFDYLYNNKQAVTGTVTLKDNGKVSVTFPGLNKYNSSPAMRYQAKQVGLAIAAAGFNHPAARDLIVRELSMGLVDALKKESTDFKAMYLDRVKVYAAKRFEQCIERNKWTAAEWLEKYGEEKFYRMQWHTDKTTGESKYGNFTERVVSARGKREQGHVFNIVNAGLEKFTASEIAHAEDHYNNSIMKLAARLNSIGITDDKKFTMRSAGIGVNFECIITHERGETRAYTIIASGPIQRPHYRYLVK